MSKVFSDDDYAQYEAGAIKNKAQRERGSEMELMRIKAEVHSVDAEITAQKLGTAESLVRDLAQALNEISETRNAVPGGMAPTKSALIARAALSRIPKEMLSHDTR